MHPKSLRPPIWPPNAKYNLLQAKHSYLEMKGQFVRFVTLNCTPQHPEAFILLTPAPKKLPRWPSPCIHVPALPLGYSSLPFQLPHTTFRQERARCVYVCVSIVRVYTHACIHSCHCCVVCAACIYLPFLKRQQRAKCGKESRKKRCLHERERKESESVCLWRREGEKGERDTERAVIRRKKERLLCRWVSLQAFLWHFLLYCCTGSWMEMWRFIKIILTRILSTAIKSFDTSQSGKCFCW